MASLAAMRGVGCEAPRKLQQVSQLSSKASTGKPAVLDSAACSSCDNVADATWVRDSGINDSISEQKEETNARSKNVGGCDNTRAVVISINSISPVCLAH